MKVIIRGRGGNTSKWGNGGQKKEKKPQEKINRKLPFVKINERDKRVNRRRKEKKKKGKGGQRREGGGEGDVRLDKEDPRGFSYYFLSHKTPTRDFPVFFSFASPRAITLFCQQTPKRVRG